MKRTFRSSWYIFLLILTGSMAEAQTREKFDVFTLSYQYFPGAKLELPAGNPSSQGLELGVSTLEATICIPQQFSEVNTVLIHGLTYNLRKVTREKWDPAFQVRMPEDLHGIDYRLVVVNELSKKWRVLLEFRPGMYSDFQEGLSTDDFKLQAAALFDRTYASGAIFGFGVAYSTTSGEGRPVPLLHLRNSRESFFNIDLLLPSQGELTYRIGEASEIGLAAGIEGNQYHLKEMNGTNPATGVNQLRYSVVTLGPHAKIRISGPWYLFFDAGATFRRRFDTYHDDTEITEFKPGNSWFLRMALKARL